MKMVAMPVRHEDEVHRVERRPRAFKLRARGVGGQRELGPVEPEQAVDEDLLGAGRQVDTLVRQERDRHTSTPLNGGEGGECDAEGEEREENESRHEDGKKCSHAITWNLTPTVVLRRDVRMTVELLACGVVATRLRRRSDGRRWRISRLTDESPRRGILHSSTAHPAGPDMPERRYDDKEVALILKRATETSAAALGEGLTLEQLKVIAAEAGIDPDAVSSAATSLDRPKAQAVAATTRSVAPQFERVVEGRLQAEDVPELLAAVRRMMGRQGVVTTEFDGVQWRARDAAGGRYISIQPQGDRTAIRGLGNFRDGAAVSAFIGGTLGAVGVAVLARSFGLVEALGIGVAPLFAVGALVPARLMWRRLFRRESTALHAAVDEAAGVLARQVAHREDAPRIAGAVDG